MKTQKSINETLLENVGKRCDFTTKTGDTNSGKIKQSGNEVWIAFGYEEEFAAEPNDIASIEHIENNPYGVQNLQTGLIEDAFTTLSTAVKKCNELNKEVANGFKTVYIDKDGIIYDSERDYINS